MRVYNGTYQLTKGIKFYNPKRFYDFNISEKQVKIYALYEEGLDAEKVHGRIISYTVSSPFPNALRIQMRHLKPEKLIKFNTEDIKVPLNIEDTENYIQVKSGLLYLYWISAWQKRTD